MRVDEVQHNNNNFTFSCEVFWIFLTPLNAASVINIPRTTRLSKVSPAVIENPMLLSKSSVLQTKPNSLQMRSARQIIFLQQLLPKQFTHVMHSFMICCGSQISTISCPLPFSPSTNVQLFCHFHSLWSVFIFSIFFCHINNPILHAAMLSLSWVVVMDERGVHFKSCI